MGAPTVSGSEGKLERSASSAEVSRERLEG